MENGIKPRAAVAHYAPPPARDPFEAKATANDRLGGRQRSLSQPVRAFSKRPGRPRQSAFFSAAFWRRKMAEACLHRGERLLKFSLAF